ncbi:HlyD family efflux transporter periplasmic adaptor subunit [Leptolyngbya sp. FACHB-17]|uniref:HlyD family efflux transporter periplasmic adaptor subunit n=1 Tax=unclassified Leptolyngbya TaxID=2650499 RepID=UPI0016807657|nr:HlyD family efflux transporter periplasmic adaptor subunit [Leptolyngbya sp. FACHB-17]
MQKRIPLKTISYGLIGALSIGSLGLGAAYLSQSKVKQNADAGLSSQPAPVQSVTALGRVEPKGSVIKVSVVNARDSRVDRLLVKQGDRVQAGQVIAILQGLDKKQAALEQAKQNVAVMQAKLAQTRVGSATVSGLSAQKAAIARLTAQFDTEMAARQAAVARAKAEARNAQASYERSQKLQKEGAISASLLDNDRRSFETATASLQEAKAQLQETKLTLSAQIQEETAKLQALSEVRPADLQVPQAEIEYAIAQQKQAETQLGDSYVRAPIAGQILRINTQIGEQVNAEQGIVDLGQTEQMYVVAEVYETDIPRVKRGQQALITSENGGFNQQLRGTVEQIGLQIKKTDSLNTDPAADKNARVVEVKIRLDPEDSKKVAELTYMQVRVQIRLD